MLSVPCGNFEATQCFDSQFVGQSECAPVYQTSLLTVQFVSTEANSHSLFYWLDEGSVSAVPIAELNEQSLEVGDKCKVKGITVDWIIAAKGKCNIVTL